MAENRRPSRGQVSLGRPRAQDNNNYEQHPYATNVINTKDFFAMDSSRTGDGAYRAGSWALQDNDDEEWEEEEQGYGGGGSQQRDYGHEEQDEDEEENPFDLSSRTHSRNTSTSARGHNPQPSLTSTTPYAEPTSSTTAFPALAGVSRRIDFTALASSSRANRGHSVAPLSGDSTTPATVKKALMPPPTTTKKQHPTKKRFTTRTASVSSSSSPTAVADPDEDEGVIGGGKAGRGHKGHFESSLKATPAEAAAAAFSRSTKQTRALKTRSRTGRIVHGAQAAQGDLELGTELERELEREVRLESGLLGVQVQAPPPVQQGQGAGVEPEMSPATALVVDTARLQLISPPPEEMLREKRRIAAQTTPSAPPNPSSLAAHIPLAGSTTPATPYPNFNTSPTSNHSPNGTATKRKRTAAAQRQVETSVDVNANTDTSYTPAGIPGYRNLDTDAQPSTSYSYSHSRNSSRQSVRRDTEQHEHEHGQREEDLYPDPEATPNPKPRKMGRVKDAFVSPTKSVSRSVSKSKSAARTNSHSYPHSASQRYGNDVPSSSSSSRFDTARMAMGMLMDESMDLDSDLLVRDSDLPLRANAADEPDDEDEDVLMASPTKAHTHTHPHTQPSRTPKTPSKSRSRNGHSKTPNTNMSRGRAPSPSPGRSRVRSVGRDEDEDETATPKVPATTPRTARKGSKAGARNASAASSTTKPNSKSRSETAKGKGKARAREESPLDEATDDDDGLSYDNEEELAVESDSGASGTSADLEIPRRRMEDEGVSTTPRKRATGRKMVLKSPHANKADADWVPDVVVRVRSPPDSGSPSSAGGLHEGEEYEDGDVLPELPSPSALASAVKSVHRGRKRSVTPIPPYEPPKDVFTPPRVVYVQPPQSVARGTKTPRTTAAVKTPKTAPRTARRRKPELKITPPQKLKIKTETPRSVLTKSGKKPKYPAYIDLTLATPMEPPSPTDDPLLLSGPVGPPIGSSSPVKRARFGGAQAYRMRVGDIPPWAPRGRTGLEGMREEEEGLEEVEIPIAEEEEGEGEVEDDGVLPPSSEVDLDAEFGTGFASDSGRSASPEERARAQEEVLVSPVASGMDTEVEAEVEEVEEDQQVELEVEREQWQGVEEDNEDDDQDDDREPRFDLSSDRTDAQPRPSSPTLLALALERERSPPATVAVEAGPVREWPGSSPARSFDASPGPSAAFGGSSSPGLSAGESGDDVPVPALEVEMEEEEEEQGVEEEVHADEGVRVDVEEDELEEEDAVLEDDMRAPEDEDVDQVEVQEADLEPERGVDANSSIEADDAHAHGHGLVRGRESRLQPKRGRADFNDFDHHDNNKDDDDVLPPSSSPLRIHLLRASSASRASLHEDEEEEVEDGAVVVGEDEEDLRSPARRFGKQYGYEHASVYVRGVDVDTGEERRVQREEGWGDDSFEEERGGEAVGGEEEELEQMEVEVDKGTADDLEPEEEEVEYMREDADAREEDNVEDSMLHGDPGDEEVAPVPVFGFDFQGAVDAARSGDVDVEGGGWSSEDDDAREGEDDEEIDDATLHTMHAQMNSAVLAQSAAGLSGRDLAVEEGEGTWSGRWRAIKVRTMMDPPSSATKGRIERWSQLRRISPVPWVGERSRSRIVEEEEELSIEEEEMEVEMSVVLDALDDDDSDAEDDEPKAAADILEDLPPPPTTPAQALQDRARAAARKSLVEAAGISKTPTSRRSAYRPSWARTQAYTVEQTPATTLPALLQEVEQEERTAEAFPSTPTLLPVSPPIQHRSPYDPANLDHSPTAAARKDKDNYRPFAFRTPVVPSELSRSLWGNAPSAVSTPVPPRNTSSPEDDHAPTSKYRSGSIDVTSASISNEKQKHSDDFLEYPAASPDHQPHQSPLLQSPFASAAKDRSAGHIQREVLNPAADEQEEEIDDEDEEEEYEYEYEYGYDAYAYDSTWTGPGARPWTRREWRLLDACFTDERIRHGKLMFPALISRSTLPHHPATPLSSSFSKSQSQSALRRRSSLGRMKKDQEDADWDFDEGVSMLRGHPLAPVEDVDMGRVVRRFLGAASGVVPLKSGEEAEAEDEFGATEVQMEEAERRVRDWGEGWDRDTLAARVAALEQKQREGRVVRMRERLARRRGSSKRRSRRATIGGGDVASAVISSSTGQRSFNAGSKSFGAPSTTTTAAKGKEKETLNPFDFSFFREQEELEEERHTTTKLHSQPQHEPRHETELELEPQPEPEPVPQSQDEDQNGDGIQEQQFVPRLQGRRGAAHPRRRVVSGASASSVDSAASATATAQGSLHVEPRTPARPTTVPTATPARPTTPTAFAGLSALRTRTASVAGSPLKVRSAPASPSKTSERRGGAQGEPRYSFLMEEAVRVHLGLESRDGQGGDDDMEVDEHEHEPQEQHNGYQGDEQEEGDEKDASQSGDDDDDESGQAPVPMQAYEQPQTQPEAAPSPGLGTRVKGFLYSYLRPSSVASNLKSTSTSTSTTTARSRVVSAPIVASSSMTGSGSSVPMGPAARARALAQAQLRAKQTTKPSARPPPPARASTSNIKQPPAKQPAPLRKGLPMQPPAVLEARAKARARTTRPVITPARPPLVKPPHSKDVVKLHPPQASSSSAHHYSSTSNSVRLNAAPTTSKARQVPVPIPRDLVRLNHVPPPIEKPVVDRAGDGPRRPRSSAGSSVKDLVGVFEEMEREAAGSRVGLRAGGGVKPGVSARDARAREAVRKWKAEARDTRPRWR